MSHLEYKINQDLEADKNKAISERTIWRLSTPDHKHHWIPLIKALTKNDASLLHHDEK